MTHATLHIQYPAYRLWPWWLLVLAWGLHPWASIPVALVYAAQALRPRHVRLAIPQQWPEVPARLQPACARLMLLHTLQAISATRLQLEALRLLCRLPRWVWLYLPPHEVATQLVPHVTWLLQCSLTATYKPVLWLGCRRWRLPRPDATDMTLSHYLQAEEALHQATKSRDWAIFLAAYLVPYSSRVGATLPMPHAHSRARAYTRLRRVAPMRAYYVLAMYEAQRAELRLQFPDAFLATGGTPIDAPTPDALDIAQVLATVVQAGELGPIRDIEAMSARAFLAWADSKRRQQREAETRRLQELIRANHQKHIA